MEADHGKSGILNLFGKRSNGLKICGILCGEDMEQLIELGVPAIGFNFWPKSKRYVGDTDRSWMKRGAGKIVRVGVFVNAGIEEILQVLNNGLIDIVQLHGDEDPRMVRQLRLAGAVVIKAVGVKGRDDLANIGKYKADGILLDTYAPGEYGGTGKSFEWDLAKAFQERFPNTPLLLAGGITVDNAAQALSKVGPLAIDVASGAEVIPGIKDYAKIKKLLKICQSL